MPNPTTATEASERLIVEGLSVVLGDDVPVIRDVSFAIERGRILGLIGESGSGKTMTCRAIVRALPHNVRRVKGRIRIGELELAEKRARKESIRTAMVFADAHASLDPLQRIGNQISEVLRVSVGLGRSAAKAEARRLLAKVLIADPERVARLYPFEVSGGMAQRAMIASVLAAQPHFLLADEPTSALDATVQLEILDLLRALATTENVGIVLTTHDMAAAARVCDSIGVMYAGRLVEVGPAADVLARPSHPYTQLLLQARPRGTSRTRLAAIPGEPPVAGERLPGCAFAPRCPFARELCTADEPALVRGAGGTEAACHFVDSLQEQLV